MIATFCLCLCCNYENVRFFAIENKLSNQIFHYTSCINYAEACNEFAGPTPHHSTRAKQLLSKKCRTSGKQLAKPCPI